MTISNEGPVPTLVSAIIGASRASAIAAVLTPMVPNREFDGVDRSSFAAALNCILFAGLLDRVPSGAAYVQDVRANGSRVCFDHGAIRTVALTRGNTGALPRGELAFRRILEPLGYEDAARYPLPSLRMTGRAYCHCDFPETIPQFFVSELHVDEFSEEFGSAAARVFGTSRDPLDAPAIDVLDRFANEQCVPFENAVHALASVVTAFDRQHEQPTIADYELLKNESAEAAWIATEGNAFNHATDRVEDVIALSDDQRRQGRPIKEHVEFSRNGRVRQTAFRADMVERGFVAANGSEERRMVPGSFYEFISRDIDPETGKLDLSFDSGNATGIFHMTKSA